MGEKRNLCRILVGKPVRKRPLGKPRCRCVDNIKMDLRDTEWGGMDWIDKAQDKGPVEDSCEQGNAPPDSIKCLEVLE
jgi:hypothetical protein